jgi:YVTN family beta-propeller protein
VAIEDYPHAVAVNPVTNKAYVANTLSDTVTVIDGSDDSTTSVAIGDGPRALAVNPVTSKVHVANLTSENVTVITRDRTQPSPLTTAIAPLPGNTTTTAVTGFSFTATSAFTPTAPPVHQIYYQVDTRTGPRLRATPDGASVSSDTNDPFPENNSDSHLVTFASLGTTGSINCGDSITADTVLESDLNCSGPGLTFGADGITLDLNGHTINGNSGPCEECPFEAGIEINGHTGVTIINGTVHGFVYGIFVQNGSHDNTVTSIVTTNNIFNGISLLGDSDDNQIEDCQSQDNSTL